MSGSMKRKSLWDRRMIPDTVFYQYLLDAKEEEITLEKRKIKALESIAESLEIISDKYLSED